MWPRGVGWVKDAPGGERDVQVLGAGDDVAHGPLDAAHRAGDHPDDGAARIGDLRDLCGGDAAVARGRHLVRRRQVRPQLEAVHGAVGLSLRHLLVDDAAAGAHPLDVARPDDARVAQAVAVVDLAAQHVGDGLHAAVRVPGEPGQVVRGAVRAEVVEQQERVEALGRIEPDGAVQVNAGPLDDGARLQDSADCSRLGHRPHFPTRPWASPSGAPTHLGVSRPPVNPQLNVTAGLPRGGGPKPESPASI